MKVTLKKTHTHAGRRRAAGDKIDVSSSQAQWLADRGVIDAPKTKSTEPAAAAGKEK